MKRIIFLIAFLIMHTGLPNMVSASEIPDVSSGAAIVMDAKTGEVLYEKNSIVRMYPASLTKVATAIYAIERGNLDDIVTVSKDARQVEGTRVYLEEGEKAPLRKLLQGLIINSGNDAAVAIAEHLDGSIEKFAENLNEYLYKIGVTHTNFENPHGLYHSEHLTTAKDLAIITQYAMKNEEFRKIFGTTELNWDGESWDTTLFTHHKLMRERPYDGVTGGKTGYIDQSGHTLLTTAKRGDTSLIVVTLNGSTQEVAYEDTTALLDYAFLHYRTSRIPIGTTLISAGNKYTTTKDYYFTQSANQNTTKRLKTDGTLEIFDQNQILLTSIKMDEMELEWNEAIKVKEKSTEKKDKELTGLISSFSIGLLLTLLSIFIFRYRRKKFL